MNMTFRGGQGNPGWVSTPINPEPLREWRDEDLPAYVSNGLIGLRTGRVPMLSGVAVVNSFAGADPLTAVETQLPIPYPLAGDVVLNGTALSEKPHAARLHEQRYDFATGELTTTLSVEACGARAEIFVRTMCNRICPTVAMQELTVRVDADCRLELSAGLDPRDRPGSSFVDRVGSRGRLGEPADGLIGWSSPGDMSRCGLAYCTELTGGTGGAVTVDGPGFVEKSFRHTVPGLMTTVYTVPATAGASYRLRQLTSIVPDVIHSSPHLHAVRMLGDAQNRGFDAIRAGNAAAWAEIWGGRIELPGAPRRWQEIADAAYFYLHTSVHRSSPSSTSPFGMAYWPNYHYYRGHVYWDIEAFAVPALLLTQPDAARALVSYRCTRLGSAVSNAEAQGYAGAQFPWESSPRDGQEATPVGALAPYTEHHVSMDVALAVARYLHATGDREFARQHGWPVLSEVARWLASRATPSGRGYEILRVNGISEAERPVNNNAYVNMCAAVTLREAIDLATALGRSAGESWQRIADGIVLPRNVDGVIVNHDGFQPNESKGDTPEAAAGLFPGGYILDPQTERQTLELALQTVDGYIGEPMLSALLGVYAARLGDRDRALELYERGVAEFVVDPFRIITEYSPVVYPDRPRAGPFTANLSGFLTGCLYGLTGLHLTSGDPAEWCRRTVTMPQGWDGVHVERLWVRGRPASLTAMHGDERGRLTFTDT